LTGYGTGGDGAARQPLCTPGQPGAVYISW
jgi:hypothetical protein